MKTETAKKKKRKCSVDGCNNYVAEGNYFLCKIHYKSREFNLDEYNSNYGERSYKKAIAV